MCENPNECTAYVGRHQKSSGTQLYSEITWNSICIHTGFLESSYRYSLEIALKSLIHELKYAIEFRIHELKALDNGPSLFTRFMRFFEIGIDERGIPEQQKLAGLHQRLDDIMIDPVHSKIKVDGVEELIDFSENKLREIVELYMRELRKEEHRVNRNWCFCSH